MTNMHVLVTTAHRGVFFGKFVSQEEDTVTLAGARNCVYWSASCHGFLGLAYKGPDPECRIGPAVPRLELRNVTSIAECTTAAITAWEAEPWN